MINTSARSRATSRLGGDGRRPILATTAIAVTMASALTIALPVLARTGSAVGGFVGAAHSGGSSGSGYSAAKAPSANISGTHHLNSAASSPGSEVPDETRAGITATLHLVGPDMARSAAGMAKGCRRD
jgi:hypothetical protein